jgi:hypothetical protein
MEGDGNFKYKFKLKLPPVISTAIMVMDLSQAPLDYLRDAAWRCEWEEIYIESVFEEHHPDSIRFYTERITDCQEKIADAGRQMHESAVAMVTAPSDDQQQLFLIRRMNAYRSAWEKKVFYQTLLRQARGDLEIEEASREETREKLRIIREKRRNLEAEIARRGALPPPAVDVNDANVPH